MAIADEELFKRMLRLERRRSERTGSRFALMLIDMEEPGSQVNAAAMEEVGEAIAAMMRETDITGWYKNSRVLGLIPTTLNGASRRVLESAVVERTRRVLLVQPAVAQLQHIWITCHIFPDDQDTEDWGGKLDRVLSPADEQDSSRKKYSDIAKRVIDVSGSLGFLLVFSPLFLLIAALIKMTSSGPVFFRQQRIGQFGKEFRFLKFRSMYVNNDPSIHREYIRKLIADELDSNGGTYKITNDPRVTRFGRLLRKTSLDELPQFVNVLRGEMSLVGPRPPIPYEFEKYSLWHRRRILEAKPGITGLWQIAGRSRTTFDEMVRMDLRYIRQQSLWLDIKILCKTPIAVLRGNGAY
jgi:lipopolysaccharide/colanic/teichoic acid biosynthesis glycosyltransferase